MLGSFRCKVLALAVMGLALAGCQQESAYYTQGGAKASAPLSPSMKAKIVSLGMTEQDPIVVRIYKQENTLEVWKRTRAGRYAKLQTYEICRWSGDLGPKVKEGDRQAPEGFYTITPGLMNPNSNYHLSFNLGFPNAYDRSLGRTGSFLMVHGACSSRGCYAMTDPQIQEIYALARESFKGGQRSFQVQAYPFRMTPENLAEHADNPNMAFWKMLKEGSDHFEVTGSVPKVDVCGRKYVFDAQAKTGSFNPSASCPAYEVPQEISIAVASKRQRDDAEFTRLVAERAKSRERMEKSRERDIMLASVMYRNDRKDGVAADAVPVLASAEPSRLIPAGGIAPTPAPSPARAVMLASAPAAVPAEPAEEGNSVASAAKALGNGFSSLMGFAPSAPAEEVSTIASTPAESAVPLGPVGIPVPAPVRAAPVAASYGAVPSAQAAASVPAPGTETAAVASSVPVYPTGTVLPADGEHGSVAVPAPSPATVSAAPVAETVSAEAPARKGSFLTRWFN
ncbi:L,D-transpeptidase family protein [Segnochrobactraceae bacterium EtOH-i3]